MEKTEQKTKKKLNATTIARLRRIGKSQNYSKKNIEKKKIKKKEVEEEKDYKTED